MPARVAVWHVDGTDGALSTSNETSSPLSAMWLTNAVLSAAVNVVLLAGVPFLVYAAYHRLRRKRSFAESARRAGLQVGEPRYIGYGVAFALLVIAGLFIWPPSLDSMLRQGSAQRQFAGLGLGAQAVTTALFYGIVKTGFAEEFLFRGLIAGSLARRLPFGWANLTQALIFLAPHLLLLAIMPGAAGILLLVFAGALVAGWLRIASGSIAGPWLMHGLVNVATALSVASRTA